MPTNPLTPRSRTVTIVAVLATLGVTACSSDDGRTLDPPVFPPPATTVPNPTPPPTAAPVTEPPVVEPLRIVAPWRDGATVPTRHTCDGENVSPALTWSNVPPDAVELAITVTDLDAPDFVHWVVYGVAPDVTGIAEGSVPEGSSLWPNDGGGVDYFGPCPPDDEQHRYLVTIHALNQQLEPADGMSATEIIEILNLTSVDQSSLSGTYARGD